MTSTRAEVDLVMQGGVTSGVVFPGALYELAKDFHFVRIGGTSAGAIAAAMLAAAECQRQRLAGLGHSDSEVQAPFETLRKLGERLAEPLLPQDPQGPRVLEGLFAPDPATEGLYQAGRAALNGQPQGAAAALLKWWGSQRDLDTFRGLLNRAGVSNLIAAQVERAGWGEALAPLIGHTKPRGIPVLTILLAASLGLTLLTVGVTALFAERLPGLWATVAAVVLVVAMLAGLVVWAASRWIRLLTQAGREFRAAIQPLGTDLLDTLTANQFGLATGYGAGEAYRLTPWLHRSLQDLAGDPGGLLTFGQLRECGIELKLVTSCLSQRRPYVLPLDQRADDFKNMYFRPDEWSRFFPGDVLAHLMQRAERMYMDPGQPPPTTQTGWSFYRLPPEADLPVVVATRLSMSFPVLFSALPLHFSRRNASNQTRIPQRWTRRRRGNFYEDELEPVGLYPVTFSDGGLTSNFPLMLFDDPIPKRPLLALNLQYRERDQQPFLAGDRQWRPFNTNIVSMGQFSLSIFETAQQWFDQSLLSLTGYGERTVNITLKRGEGGLNLSMDAQTIAFLTSKGASAGALLAARFRPGGTDQWNQAGLLAFHWRNVVTDLGELLMQYAETYPETNLEHLLTAMPWQDNGQQFKPNSTTLQLPERKALKAIQCAAEAVKTAQRPAKDALFPCSTPWNVPGVRDLRGLLRYRPFL
jgi:predicted acylesterase/phospholipase RssA